MSDYLPEALVLEILYRLPPTTLVRCTLVCKAWNTIIKSHTFISSHLQRSLSIPIPPLLLIHHYSPFDCKEQCSLCSHTAHLSIIAELEYSFSVRPQFFFRFVGTVNGIVCLSDDVMEYTDVIILWNPLIKKHVELPKPLFTSYILDPHMYVLGFGFDSKKNDYKVVRVCYLQENDVAVNEMVAPQVELYSLNEGAWRVIDASCLELRVDECSMEQCYLHGNVHWLAYDITQNAPFQHNCVLMFNVEEEEFKKMKLPEELGTISLSKLAISATEGCLSVIEYSSFGSYGGNTRDCNIWMSREYGVAESWSKMYSVNLQGGIGKVMGLRTSSEVLVVPYPQNRSLRVFPNGVPVSLYSFDPKSQNLRRLGIRGTVAGFYASDYTGSLVLLDRVSDAIPCCVNKSCIVWVQDDESGVDSDQIDSKERKEN